MIYYTSNVLQTYSSPPSPLDEGVCIYIYIYIYVYIYMCMYILLFFHMYRL